MSLFLCKLWPYLAGGLIGWLLVGWMARRFRHSEPTKLVDNPEHLSLISKLKAENKKIPTLVSQISNFKSTQSKTVDNSQHLSLISKLETENKKIPDLLTKLARFESSEPNVVEKIVEVNNPDHLKRIAVLEKENSEIAGLQSKLGLLEKENGEIAGLRSKLTQFESAKPVDNPEHLKHIAALEKENSGIAGLQSKLGLLEKENSEIAGLRSKLTQFENAKPVDNPEHLKRIAALEKENSEISGLQSKLSLLENAEPKVVEKEVEKEVDNPLHLSKIKALESELDDWKRTPAIDISAAKSAGITVKADGDFAAIEGVGPKINELLHAGGIKSYKQLAETDPTEIKTILDKGGASFKMANPDTWPDQANLASNNRWPALKALQDVLDGGVYPNKSSASTTSSSTKASKADSNKISDLEKELDTYRNGQVLDKSAAKASGIIVASDSDFTAIEGIGPKINDLLHAGGIKSFKQLSETDPAEIKKILDGGGASFKMANPSTWPDQANLVTNNRWPALKALQDILDGGVYPDSASSTKSANKSSAENKQHLVTINDLENKLESYQKGPDLDTGVAKAAGFNVKRSGGKDDFTVVEGIGPKINDLIHDAGIHTFTELANTSTAVIQTILDDAGARYKLAKPDTWPAQSNLAASNQWGALKAWQDILDGGEE